MHFVEATEKDLCFEIENHVDDVIPYLPASTDMLQKIRSKLLFDSTITKILSALLPRKK